ncbi:DUF899 family protein [Nocardia tengchongensis]|uniref:DUF899 family protein n=1 Tax=Nocardia tengchongensis TaxID=2055889 RepID=UPI003650351D
MDVPLPAAPPRSATAEDVNLSQLAARADWLIGREEVLVQERATARPRDAILAQRHRLPMIKLDREYRFEACGAVVSLLDLFDGLPRLLVCHFVLGPGAEGACPNCHAAAEKVSEHLLDRLRGRDISFAMVSRAPLSQIERYKERQGWHLPWFSSLGAEFDRNFLRGRNVGFLSDTRDRPSVRGREDSRLFHSSALFARHAETLGNWCYWLDLTPRHG